MGRIAFLVFIVAMTYFIFRTAFKAWQKASLKEKLSRAEEIEAEYKTVQAFDAQHPDIKDKNKSVNKFKKETL